MSGGAARLDDVAVGALQDVLGTEHAALWCYSLGVAFLPPAQVATARTDAAAHRELRAQIEVTLTQLGQRPVSAQPAYATPQPVTDAASAAGLLVTAETDAAAAWMPWVSRPCIGLAPGAKGSPLRRPSGVFPVALPYTTFEVMVRIDCVWRAWR